MRIGTHPGNFHADEVFAVATLALTTDEPPLVVRTRDEGVLAACDVRVDVGGRSDPSTGDFDHHQRGGAGERPNGIRYASFGLVWREHGIALTASQDAADAIDQRIVQGVDANDTGQTIMTSLVGDVRPMSISGIIGAMNAAWDEELTSQEEDARFADAVDLARRILERELAGAAAFGRAQQLVRAAIARAGDPRVVELDRNMPWREAVVTEAPEALFVAYPKSDGWGLQAVPRELGQFANRLDLPEEWAGRSGADLARVSGVPDAVFCHAARFYASAGSRAGVMALAAGALERSAP
jgi:uncharacterized UPF0160 family protein